MYKKILSLLMSVAAFSGTAQSAFASEDSFDGYVYFTAEKLTINQGFVTEPIKVGYYTADTLADITERALGDKSTHTGEVDDTYFLNSINDGGIPDGWTIDDIPSDIVSAVNSATDWQGNPCSITDRSNETVLSGGDYSSISGWIFSVDNTSLNVGAGGVVYSEEAAADCYTDGSIIRVMFSVYGYGADTGLDSPYYTFETENTFPDKSELIKAAADMSFDGITEAEEDAYNTAISALSKWDVSETEIEEALTAATPPQIEYTTALSSVSDYLCAAVENPSRNGADWILLALARSGYDNEEWYNTYFTNLKSSVCENESAVFDPEKSTENSRTIIALSAIGRNAQDICGYDLTAPLADFDFVTAQGVNGAVYALIALNSSDYEIPTCEEDAVQTTREKLLEYILSAQLTDGGWSYDGVTADPDMTAMVITSLAPYYSTDANVETSVNKALDVISDIQNETGNFTTWGNESSESCSQVLLALSTLGIADDERFIKNGNSVLDALMEFYDSESGAFRHTADGQVNRMASEQAAYALAAYDRFKNGENTIFNMSDAEKYGVAEIKLTVKGKNNTTEKTVDISELAPEKSSVYDVLQYLSDHDEIVFEDNGNKLNINGDNSEWSCTVNSQNKGSTLKTITLKADDNVIISIKTGSSGSSSSGSSTGRGSGGGSSSMITGSSTPSFGLAGRNMNIKYRPVVLKGKTFTDITDNEYKSKIEALAERNIINGKSDDIFDPDNTMTRAEYAAIIVKAFGFNIAAEKIFDDVNLTDWHCGYIATAYKYGIIKGISATEFNPEGTITHEEAATMTARAAKLCGIKGTMTQQQIHDMLAQFDDYTTVSDWAEESLAFCYTNGIKSQSAISITPLTSVKRCEIADMVYNMLEKAKLL